MTAKRDDLPKNPEMDAHREASREAILEYMKNMGREERKGIVKEAISEWMTEKWNEASGSATRRFLWAAAVSIAGALGYFVLTANGWHK